MIVFTGLLNCLWFQSHRLAKQLDVLFTDLGAFGLQVTYKAGDLLWVTFGVTDLRLLGLQVLLNAYIRGSDLRKCEHVFIACLVQRVTVAIDRIWIIVFAYGRLWGIITFDLGPELSIWVIRSLNSLPVFLV